MSLNIPKSPEDLKQQYQSTSLAELTARLTREKSRSYFVIKRVLDVMIALFVLIVLLPIGVLIALIIRLTDGEKALFIQERTGKNGKQFRCYKWRTMYPRVAGYEFAPTTLSDPRITKIGRILRRTSLDEIPQLINVLKGEMTLVGPRPEMQFITEKYTEPEKLRLLVTPGITGLWQVMGRKDLPLHENVEYDFFYIEHQSALLDLIIIFRTFHVIISGKGAY